MKLFIFGEDILEFKKKAYLVAWNEVQGWGETEFLFWPPRD